jgi:hypothetical protein
MASRRGIAKVRVELCAAHEEIGVGEPSKNYGTRFVNRYHKAPRINAPGSSALLISYIVALLKMRW